MLQKRHIKYCRFRLHVVFTMASTNNGKCREDIDIQWGSIVFCAVPVIKPSNVPRTCPPTRFNHVLHTGSGRLALQCSDGQNSAMPVFVIQTK